MSEHVISLNSILFLLIGLAALNPAHLHDSVQAEHLPVLRHLVNEGSADSVSGVGQIGGPADVKYDKQVPSLFKVRWLSINYNGRIVKGPALLADPGRSVSNRPGSLRCEIEALEQQPRLSREEKKEQWKKEDEIAGKYLQEMYALKVNRRQWEIIRRKLENVEHLRARPARADRPQPRSNRH